MKFFLLAWIFLMSMAQLGRIQVSSNVSFYLHDILVFIFLSKTLFDHLGDYRKIIEKLKKNKKIPKIIILSLICSIFLSWFISGWQQEFDYRSILYTIRFLAYALFAYLLKQANQHRAKPWVLGSTLLMFFGLVQYILLPDLRFIALMGYDDHFYRLSGTMLDPSFLGLIMVFASNYQLLNKKPSWLLLVFLSIAIALTYSRAVYVSFLLSTIFIFFYQKHSHWRHKILILLLGFIFILPILPKQSGGAGVDLSRTFSMQQRIGNNQLALQQMNFKEWLIGRGLFSPQDRNQDKTGIIHAHFPDNIIVFLLNSLGIIGTILVFLLLLRSVNWRNQLQVTLLSSLLIHSMFNHNLTHSFVMLFFWGFFYSRNSTSIERSV